MARADASRASVAMNWAVWCDGPASFRRKDEVTRRSRGNIDGGCGGGEGRARSARTGLALASPALRHRAAWFECLWPACVSCCLSVLRRRSASATSACADVEVVATPVGEGGARDSLLLRQFSCRPNYAASFRDLSTVCAPSGLFFSLSSPSQPPPLVPLCRSHPGSWTSSTPCRVH